ncbi:MAG: hypothetical protein Kow0029_01800 [Candidatus Rifleibacteriota bacterium]
MISIFLHLLLLGYGTVHFRGYYAEMPLTAMVIWTFVSMILIFRTVPDIVDRLKAQNSIPSFVRVQEIWQWSLVVWIIFLHVFSDPAKAIFGKWLETAPQFLPMLLSTALYVICARPLMFEIYRLFRPILDDRQTADDFFRARMTVPILFFPPMLFWMLIEDLSLIGGGIEELADIRILIAAPIFFVLLYLWAPRLFNWAWHAEKMDDEELRKKIVKLCETAETPISGVKIWNTFREPVPNAAVAGLSSRYRFVYITRYLLEIFTGPQVMGVIAHELAHLRLGHVFNYMIYSLDLVFLSITAKLMLFVFFPSYADGSALQDGIEMIAFLVLFGITFTALARECEYQADAFAACLVGSEIFSSGLETLEKNIMPPPKSIPGWLLTHPEIQDRISRVKSWKGEIGELVSKSRKIRLILIALGCIFVAASVPALTPVLQLTELVEAVQTGNQTQAVAVLSSLPEWLANHPLVIRETGELAMMKGRWDIALVQAAKANWNMKLNLNLEEFHHSASPEVTLNLKLMKFVLQTLDLGRVHGVSLFK